jgi:hypothetical protein
MVLPSSGLISIQALATEFSQALTVPLESYYAGAGIVSSGTVNATSVAVPTSGAISLFNFYGVASFTNITHTFFGTGSNTETIPSGAGNVTIEVWGPGGGGTSGHLVGCSCSCGAGGGGGAYTRSAVISVAGHTGGTINVFVGTGGAGGAANAAPGTQAGNGSANSSVNSHTFTLTTMNAGPGFGAKGPTVGNGSNIHTGGTVGTNGNPGSGTTGGAAIVGVHASGNGAGGAGRPGHIQPGSPGGNGGVVFFYTL